MMIVPYGVLMRTAATYVATREGLKRIKKYPCLSRRQQWPREMIAALRAAPRIGDHGRYRVVLEIQTPEDRKVTVLGGSPDFIRYLATQFRDVLEVPATAPQLDGTNLATEAWQTGDEPSVPADARGSFQQGEGMLLYTRPRRKASVGMRACIVTCLIFFCASCIIPPLALPHVVNQDDRTALLLMSGLVGLLALMMVLAALGDLRRTCVIVATPEKLTISSSYLIGGRHREWLRGAIAAIRLDTWAPAQPKLNQRLAIELRDGGVFRCLGGGENPQELRHLATRLRGILRVPAVSPAENGSHGHAGDGDVA